VVPLSDRGLVRALIDDKGLKSKKSNGARFWLGIELRQQQQGTKGS
jgi:hypothetical protein